MGPWLSLLVLAAPPVAAPPVAPAPVVAPAPSPAGLAEDPLLPGRPHVLRGHADGVQVFAFSPDGSRLVSAGRDRLLRVWDAKTGAPLASLALPAQPSALAFSADGQRLAVGSVELQALVVDLSKPAVLQTLAHPDTAVDVAFSPDGTVLAVAGGSDTGALYVVASPEKKVEFRGRSAAFSPDGKGLLVANGAGPFGWLDPATGKARKSFSRQEERARGLQSADGSLLATWVPMLHEVKLWSPAGKRLGTITLPAPPPEDGVQKKPARLTAVGLSRDGTRLVTASNDGQLRVWSASGGAPLGSWPIDSAPAVGFSPDGAWVVAADGALLKWWKVP